jgi:serine/threonine-protein kinase
MSLSADICGALDFSHRNGIVHRDVKPGNVMITPQGTVKVMDFGIARAVSDSAATMTSTAAVIGTAQYLSPEQARGESVDARSDVYSLGCMLYELVTGAPPFTGDSPVAVAYQHVREDPKLPSSINPAIPAELDAILLKAMSKNPANRYQSAADMRNDLLRALAGQRVEATPVMGDAEKTTILAAARGGGYGGGDGWDDEAEQDRKRRKRRIIAIVSVLAVLLLGGAIAIAVAMSNGDPETPAVEQVQVPALANLEQAAAEQALADAGLEVGTVTTEASTTVAEGLVIRTSPAGGAQVQKGSTVDLFVSGGPDTLTIPNVVGLDEDRALATLEQAKFTTITTQQVESLKEEGAVVGISPQEGSQAAPNAPIRLQVSTGTVRLPDVSGRGEDEARRILTEAGFSASQVVNQSVERDDAAAGTVVGTEPGTGTAVGADDEIVLLIAVPTPPTPTPSPSPSPSPSSSPPADDGGTN